jgi:demethylmenaquinone methyltransferase/2-methoxy-6-polyprenyl-1,4-benzoquinol methylase
MSEHATSVRQMFTQIAGRYDRLNRIMTFGMDILLRREAVRRLDPQPGQVILDDGAGTGDLTFEVLRRSPQSTLVACDFTHAMLVRGRQRDSDRQVSWVLADAQNLPFVSHSFEGLICGYLDVTLDEQTRVIKPAGRLVSLDTTPPQENLIKPFLTFYLEHIIPLLGRLFAGNLSAYTYLEQSTEGFLDAEQLGEHMRQAGFKRVTWVRRLFGSMAIHLAQK